MAIVKNVIGVLGGLLPLKVLFKYYWSDFIVLTYHSLSGHDIDPEINKFPYRTKSAFSEDMRYITNHFNVLGLKEFLEIHKKGDQFPERSVLITFDDGLAIQYDHIFPILKSFKIPATFFINNAFIDNRDLHYERKKYVIVRRIAELQDKVLERKILKTISEDHDNEINLDLKSFVLKVDYKSKVTLDFIADKLGIPFKDYLNSNRIYLSTQEIDTMLKNNITIGGHSIDHPNFIELSLGDQVKQVLSSVNDLVKRFQLDYKAFAFPYNDRALDTALFEKISADIDVTFGTSDLCRDEFKMHFQRGSIDNSTQNSKRAIAALFAKYYGLKLSGKHFIKRY